MNNATEGTPEDVNQHTVTGSLCSVQKITALTDVPPMRISEKHLGLHQPKLVSHEDISNSSLCSARLDSPIGVQQKTKSQSCKRRLQELLT
jgi:hypothetical protein